MIYFLQRANGDIKIGTSEKYWTRLVSLKMEHGQLTLLGWIEGGRESEQAIHNQFTAARVGSPRSEWFRPVSELLQFIESECLKTSPDNTLKDRRITVDALTLLAFRDFADGLGETSDNTLNYLLRKVIGTRDPLHAGRELRDDLKNRMSDLGNNV
jgi:hypothetical protein